MRLASFRIQNYKIIDDTGAIPVDPDVTALVGVNESGKTAVLRSLWKSQNAAGEAFDKQLDYPRARYARDRKKSQYLTTLTYALTEDEANDVAALFPFDLDLAPDQVTLQRWYRGEDETGSEILFEDRIEQRCTQGSAEAQKIVDSVAQELGKHVGIGDNAIAVAHRNALSKFDPKQPAWQKGNQEVLSAFKDTVDQWIAGAAERAAHAEEERERLAELVAGAEEGDPAARAREWAEEHVPAFIYFDDYGQLETRIHLPTYIQQSKEKAVAAKVRTQRALFTWSGIDPQEILDLGRAKEGNETDEDVQRRLDKRRTLLESASFDLTGKWADWWIPGTRHRLHIAADGPYLVLNVSDSNNQFPIPFEERSHGFQWFFSFYLVFLVESEDAHEGSILLLDEPGLHLHPMMQRKLVGFFDRVAQTNQVLYSTHLPFLIDGDHLERVRVVYLNKETPPKTMISKEPCAGGDRDSLFPLQAALGYSIAQTLFLGKCSAIVEGGTDYALMKALNGCLAALHTGARLHDDVVLVPAFGIKRLMPLASIMFATSGVEGRRMLVLLDSDDAGETAKHRLKQELFGDDSGVLMLGSAIRLPEATIEDLLPRDDYAKAVAAALGRKVDLNADELAAPTNVAALKNHWQRKGWGAFGVAEKATTALWLVDNWNSDPELIPLVTRIRASALLAAINRRFEQ